MTFRQGQYILLIQNFGTCTASELCEPCTPTLSLMLLTWCYCMVQHRNIILFIKCVKCGSPLHLYAFWTVSGCCKHSQSWNACCIFCKVWMCPFPLLHSGPAELRPSVWNLQQSQVAFQQLFSSSCTCASLTCNEVAGGRHCWRPRDRWCTWNRVKTCLMNNNKLIKSYIKAASD